MESRSRWPAIIATSTPRAFVEPTLGLLGEQSLYRRAGIQLLHFNTLFQLAAWRHSSPETLAKARRFAMIPDFGPLTQAATSAVPFRALVDADDQAFFQPASMKQALEAWWRKMGQSAPEGPGGYARSCLEGLVLAFRKTLEQIEAIRGIKLQRVHLVGGGSQNSLLCQLTADATVLPVYAGPIEASALGNLIVQARSLGWVSDLAEARRLVERSFPLVEYQPRGDTLTKASVPRARRATGTRASRNRTSSPVSTPWASSWARVLASAASTAPMRS